MELFIIKSSLFFINSCVFRFSRVRTFEKAENAQPHFQNNETVPVLFILECKKNRTTTERNLSYQHSKITALLISTCQRWMTSAVQSLMGSCDAFFRTGDKYSSARSKPKRGRFAICRTTGGRCRTIYRSTTHGRYGKGYISSPTTGRAYLYPQQPKSL